MSRASRRVVRPIVGTPGIWASTSTSWTFGSVEGSARATRSTYRGRAEQAPGEHLQLGGLPVAPRALARLDGARGPPG